MDDIKFECVRCGAVEKRSVLLLETSIKGEARHLSSKALCCEDPCYIDSRNVLEPPAESNVKDLIKSKINFL